jgi:hypothetical protein
VTRRDIVAWAGLGAVALAIPGVGWSAKPPKPCRGRNCGRVFVKAGLGIA